MTRLIVQPSNQGISLAVTLAHMAEVLANTPDAGLPAYESVMLELTPEGSVIVTRADQSRYSYSHPKSKARQAIQSEPAQLKLFDARTA